MRREQEKQIEKLEKKGMIGGILQGWDIIGT
jgi:hypothetical protein